MWAKHLFSQLFGEPDADNDVSPETEEGEEETAGEEERMEGNRDAINVDVGDLSLGKGSSQTWKRIITMEFGNRSSTVHVKSWYGSSIDSLKFV